MHRSGTSLVARILNLLGVYLGPAEALLPAAVDNPKGFWEHRSFIELNDEILARLGGDAMHPPLFPPEWHVSPTVSDLRQRAGEFLQQDFGRAKIWGWKDPRTCLTLPFWQHLLPPMRYVLCLRHPLDVARSLKSRNNIPLARGVFAWLKHVKLSLRYTVGKPRLLVDYERLLAEWKEEIHRIASFVERPGLADQPEMQQEIGLFLDPNLRHHRTAPGVTQPAGLSGPAAQLVLWAEQVYLRLRDLSAASIPEAEPVLDRALGIAEAALETAQDEEEQEWKERIDALARALAATIPAGSPFILVDDAQIEHRYLGRAALPFLERDGKYWGPPEDNAKAISELDRLRRSGAGYIVFAWPAFWWLKYYSEFALHLRANYRCVLENERLIAFDLQQAP
jgi:hypothetical protein